MKWRGVFSKAGAGIGGTAVWTKEDGSEVEVVSVCDLDTNWRAFCRWDDARDIGPVISFVRRGRLGTLGGSIFAEPAARR